MTRYYLDTYAIIEIIKGKESYKKFSSLRLYTSIFNLYELYYSLLRDFGEEIAKKYFLYFKKNMVLINDEYIFAASKFKLKYVKKCLSYADCLGYIIALKNDMKFLTGDKEFEDLENVEFVK